MRCERKARQNKHRLLRRPIRSSKELSPGCWVESQALLSLSSRALSQPLHHARYPSGGLALD